MFAAYAALALSLILTIRECVRFAKSRRTGQPASVLGLIILFVLNAIALTFVALIVIQHGFGLN